MLRRVSSSKWIQAHKAQKGKGDMLREEGIVPPPGQWIKAINKDGTV